MSTINNLNVDKENTTTLDYDSTAYDAYRPTYSSRLYTKIYEYHTSHSSAFSTALDVATGTGSVARELSKTFQQVYANDISQDMISSASAFNSSNIQYSVSAAEDLSQFQDSTFDLVTIATALHWTDSEKFFKEAWRVLKQNGTLAIFGYSSSHIVNGYPTATKEFKKFTLETFGDYSDPRIVLIDNMYRDIVIPDELFKNIIWERNEYDEKEGKMNDGECYLSKEWSVEQLKNFMKTWSLYRSYMSKCQKENQEIEDPVDKLFEKLKEKEGWTEEQILKISWSFVLGLAEKN
ncbi:S-adenosyl-L-methionine-dependent methyltransferase [Gigaspora margarita]|uniref:S-adenosyl-L-methionine-dependent methyltransferase n=1 Tax=Gigaspora margarita TaxID=4874 RepID=A0A8H3X2T9_GIGMA|nr:S-adenosyl-L-methionine-dependent methyltransferase [Gigaspora margarita]